MFKRYVISIIIFLSGIGAAALPVETNYLGTVVISGYDDDTSYGPLNIDFTFNFYGTNYSQFYINTNGMILFGTGSSESAAVTIPSGSSPNNFIAPFWDDLVVDPSGKILYTTIGVSPNRKLIIQFTNMGFYTYPVILGTFQVILYESSNKIQTQYRLLSDNNSTRTHGGTATIGIENSAGDAGTLYSFQNPTAISSGKAISFTPPGPTYTVNSNAVYEGIYLTTNLSTPEPGIPSLLSPYENAITGADITFDWTSASNAEYYTIKVSPNSDLSGAKNYNAGTSLTYDTTGLTLDAIYYWGVYATNATGTTWCEIKKFYTSSAPPLTPVPQTIWTEQFQDKTISLLYTGGDAMAKTAVITSLPAQGQLYQYNAGVRGSPISSVPTTVTDAGRNVIYAASGTSGNGVGNFNFLINDIHGDSPEATITVNVSPPGVPDVLNVAKNTNVEIQFDIPMADPTGKQNQFTVNVNSTPVTINSASLKPGDPNTIILTLSTPLAGTETVTVAYTQGNITGSTGGFLFSFTAQPVTLKAQTIIFSQSLSKKYSDSPLTLTATSSSGLGLTYSSSNLSVATVSSNILTFHALGSSEITARQAGNGTWAPANYAKTLNAAKGDQTITFGSLPVKTYGNSDLPLTATASSGLIVSYSSDNTSVATIVSGNIHIVGAGTAVITASQTGNSLWNAATPVQRTLTVNKASLTITSDARIKVYGTANPVLTFTYSGWVNGVETIDTPPIVSTTVTLTTGAGVYTGAITVTGGTDNNYNFTYVPADFTVTKATLTVTTDAQTKAYGAANPVLTFTYSGWVNGVETIDTPPTVSTTVALTTGAGVYTGAITVTGGTDNNYNFTYVPAYFAVTKATLTVTADAQTKVYCAANPVLTFTYSGWVNGAETIDTPPTVSTTVTLTTGAGVYTGAITVTGGTDNNYNFTYVPADFTVTKATLTVTAGAQSKVYGAANPVLTFTYSGWVNGVETIDTPPTVSTTVTLTTPVGTYTGAIIVNGGVDNNYNFNYVVADFTVTKANQTIAFSVLPVKTFGDADFTPIVAASSGLIVSLSSDNASVVTIVNGNIHITGSGSAVITASQAGDVNYNAATNIQQTLTVSKIPQIITFSGVPLKLLVEDSYTLVASSTSGITVLFASMDNQLATVTGDLLTGVLKGNVSVRAYNAGDQDYDAAEVFATVEIYSTHKDIMYLFTPNGDGFNDYWELPDLATWGKCDVKVYNRWGKLVFADTDYNNLWNGTSDGAPVPEGAYYFIIKTENEGTITGTLNIVR
jgi:gliding motility-associated-like protein